MTTYYKPLWDVNMQIPSAERNFFFKKMHSYFSRSPERQVTVVQRSDCHLEFAQGRVDVTKMPWCIPMWWLEHQTKGSDWLWMGESKSVLRCDNRLWGHIPQTKCLLRFGICNLGDTPTNRSQQKMRDSCFFLDKQTEQSRLDWADHVVCQWVHKKRGVFFFFFF